MTKGACKAQWRKSISLYYVQNLNIVNVLCAIQLSSDFYKVQIRQIMGFFILSVALVRLGTILLVVRDVTRIKTITLESKWECSKGLIEIR